MMPLNVPQIISDVVNETAYELGYDVQFKHGTWKHIMQRILNEQGGTNPNQRFPLICLVQVFEEKFRQDSEYSEVTLTFLICNVSQPNWYSEDRYTNNFIPTLYPIYAKFLEKLAECQYVWGYKNLYFEHTKADDLYLPENDANKLPECLDGVWIKDLKLKLDVTKCPIQYPVVNSICEFTDAYHLNGVPNGTDIYEFNVTLSDVRAITDGSSYVLRVKAGAGDFSLTSSDTNLTILKDDDEYTITIEDGSLATATMQFVASSPAPPSTVNAIAKVLSMSGLRPNWVNESNIQDTITI